MLIYSCSSCFVNTDATYLYIQMPNLCTQITHFFKKKKRLIFSFGFFITLCVRLSKYKHSISGYFLILVLAHLKNWNIPLISGHVGLFSYFFYPQSHNVGTSDARKNFHMCSNERTRVRLYCGSSLIKKLCRTAVAPIIISQCSTENPSAFSKILHFVFNKSNAFSIILLARETR